MMNLCRPRSKTPCRTGRRGWAEAGFTLVEMVVTVAILGILVTIAVPSFNSLIQNSRGKRAAETIDAFLVNAKSEAVKRNAIVRVVFTSSGGGATWCAGLTTNDTCDCTTADSCQLDSVNRVLDGSNFANVVLASVTTNPLGFDPARGIAEGQNGGTVTVQAETGQQYEVVLSGRGRIRMCVVGGSAGGYPACT